ncbi:MAG: amino acid permease [Candidatus Acidiferrales bacterium]
MAQSKTRLELVRGLGPWASMAIVVGTMIGTGIFLKPAEMARDAGSVGIVFAAWVVGGVLSLFGALAYAELGAAIPEAGGEYAYLSRSFGPRTGFLFGWTHSIVARPASAASIAAGVLRFWGFLMPSVMSPIHEFDFDYSVFGRAKHFHFVFGWAQPLAILMLVAITGINYLGVRLGGRVQVILTAIKIASVVLIIVAAFSLSHGGGTPFHPFFAGSLGTGALGGFLAAMAAAMWAYDGWEDLNLVGSEVEKPERNFHRALVGGVAFVAGVYILFNAASFYVLPMATVGASQHVASDVVAKIAGVGAATWVTVAMVIAGLGSLNSSILSGARVDYAMARDGIFFRIAGGIHPKFRTPSRALIFQCVLASVLALTGTFEDLTSLFIFAGWIFYGLATIGLFRLRRIEPNMPRPYRCWGYPWVPAAFVAGALALTINLWLDRPVRCTVGLVLMFVGLFFYRYWHRNATNSSTA